MGDKSNFSYATAVNLNRFVDSVSTDSNSLATLNQGNYHNEIVVAIKEEKCKKTLLFISYLQPTFLITFKSN